MLCHYLLCFKITQQLPSINVKLWQREHNFHNQFCLDQQSLKVYFLAIYNFLLLKMEFRKNKDTSKHSSNSKNKLNIMIDEIFPKTFDESIWQVISSMTPSTFICEQEDLMNILMTDEKLFESFFKRFYMNHFYLHNWYMLARENQLQIKKYVFKKILDRSYKDYKEIIKEEEVKNKFTFSKENIQSFDKIKDKKNDSFHKMQIGNSKDKDKISLPNNFNDSQRQKNKQKQYQNFLVECSKEDYHQLFLRTFNACDGSKYIYYDFDRHMKGVEKQKQYNNFIRVKKHDRNHQSMTIKQFCSTEQAEKLQCVSTYQTSKLYLHKEQEKYARAGCSKFDLNPIGCVKNQIQNRNLYVIKKLPNVLKKYNPNHKSTKVFLLKKKKVL